jgi:3-phosphoshikimate 1-carboxyvinyltransferase
MRLMTGALAGVGVAARLIGDESLSLRPMRRLVEPLSALGAGISVAPDGTPPIDVAPRPLTGAEVSIPTSSAQVRSAYALAAINASGTSSIDSPAGFRDHTERWLAALGLGEYETDTRFRVEPGPIPALNITVPGDPSSAAFLWACAAAIPGARVTTPGVSANPGRLGFLEVLERMGARIDIEHDQTVLDDAVATITVTGRSLVGVEVSGSLTVRALDELPLVAVLASIADGPTVVGGAAELRVKESDRIAASIDLAALAGASGIATNDGFEIRPGTASVEERTIASRGDHRVAMAAAVSAAITGASVTVHGFEASHVSWPGFKEALEALWS